MTKGTLSIAVLMASAAISLPVSVHAQQTPQVEPVVEDGKNPNPDDAGATNDIVVTAQRTSQRLQDVPLSVQAISGDAIRDRGITDQRQLTLLTPTLQVQNDNNYTIRGIGTQSFATTIEGSVATAIDDVTLGSRFLNGNPFLDIDRVEVLNGPQGLLFGKNASAGLVNITTTRPVLGKYGAEFDMQATSNDRPGENALGAQARSTINVPVGDNSALRLSGVYVYQEPPIFYRPLGNSGRVDTDYRQYGGRAKYLFEPSDRFSVYLLGEYFESRGIGTQFDSTYRSLAANSVNAQQLAADGVTAGPRNFVQTFDAAAYRDLNTGGAQGTVSYELGNGFALTDTLAWKFYDLDQQFDGDTTGGNGANINRNQQDYDQYSNELRLALPSAGKLTGQVGLYYFESTLSQVSQIAGNNLFPSFLLPRFPFCVGATISLPSPPGCASSNDYFLGSDKNYTIKNRSYAAFGQLTYNLSSQFNVFAGGRVTRDRVSMNLTQNTGRYFAVLGFPNGIYDQSYANTDFSWKVGAQFKPTDNIMFYGTYGRGYKAPGFNDAGATANANLVVFPETTKTAEVGVKSSFADRRITVNVSAFSTKFDNFQIQSFDPSLRAFVIGNAAKVDSKGIEALLQVRPVTGLTLSASGAFIDSTFDRYTAAQCYPTQPNASCAANGTFDASGYRLAFAPKFTSTVTAAYEVPVFSGDTRLSLQGDWYHRSLVQSAVNQAPGSQIGTIDIFNGTIGLRGSNWNAGLFCRNCSNKIYARSIGVEAGDASASPARLSYTQYFGLDSIRTIGLRFGFNY